MHIRGIIPNMPNCSRKVSPFSSMKYLSKSSKKQSDKTTIPDSVIEQIEEIAKKDVANGITQVNDSEFFNFRETYLEEHVSPDREKIKQKIGPMLSSALHGTDIFFDYPSLLFSGNLSRGLNGMNYASIYDENGELILGYHRNEWQVTFTNAERYVNNTLTAIYNKAVRQEEKMAKITESTFEIGNSFSSSLDMHI